MGFDAPGFPQKMMEAHPFYTGPPGSSKRKESIGPKEDSRLPNNPMSKFPSPRKRNNLTSWSASPDAPLAEYVDPVSITMDVSETYWPGGKCVGRRRERGNR